MNWGTGRDGEGEGGARGVADMATEARASDAASRRDSTSEASAHSGACFDRFVVDYPLANFDVS